MLGDEPEQYLAVPQAEALAALAQRVSPVAVLVSSGPEGKDVAARVAVRLDSGIITDAIAVALVAGPCGHPVGFAGSWPATSEVVRGTPVVTVRPNAVSAEPAPAHPVGRDRRRRFSDAARGARITDPRPSSPLAGRTSPMRPWSLRAVAESALRRGSP